jgi:hypothetical protein
MAVIGVSPRRLAQVVAEQCGENQEQLRDRLQPNSSADIANELTIPCREDPAATLPLEWRGRGTCPRVFS